MIKMGSSRISYAIPVLLAIVVQILSIKLVFAYNCNRNFFKRQGVIDVINNSSSSTSTYSCTFKIKTPDINNSPSRAILSWRYLDIDSKMPYCASGSVTIKVGCNNPKEVAKFCSRNMKRLPHKIYSHDSCITIEFFRTKYGAFRAWYESDLQSTPQARSCYRSVTVTRLPYAIITPGWPVSTKESYCEWKIRLDRGQKVVVNVMDMDGFSYKSSSAYCPYSNYMSIKGKKSKDSSFKTSWYLCRSTDSSKQLPSLKSYQYYEMDIKIKISRSYLQKPGRGVVIGLVAYDEERLVLRFSSWTSVFVGIATIFIILLLLFCWYRRCRRQRLLENQPMIIQGATVQTTQPTYPAQVPSAYPVQQYPPSAYPAQVPPPYQPPPYNDLPPPGQYPSASGATAPPGYLPPYPQQGGPQQYPQQGIPPYPQQNPNYPAYSQAPK